MPTKFLTSNILLIPDQETFVPEFFRPKKHIYICFNNENHMSYMYSGRRNLYASILLAKLFYFSSYLTDLVQHERYVSRFQVNKIFCQSFCLKLQYFLQISGARCLPLPFMRGLLKNFPDYKNFPCSNATTLQGVLGLCPTPFESFRVI